MGESQYHIPPPPSSLMHTHITRIYRRRGKVVQLVVKQDECTHIPRSDPAF